MKLAEYFESLVRGSSLFEIVTPRSLALVVFRLAPSAPAPNGSTTTTTFDAPKLDSLNLELHKRIIEGADGVFITRTELNGKACLRMAIGGERTQEGHVLAAFEAFEKKAKALLSEGEGECEGERHAATEAAVEATEAEVTPAVSGGITLPSEVGVRA